jgi:hypothetical protein
VLTDVDERQKPHQGVAHRRAIGPSPAPDPDEHRWEDDGGAPAPAEARGYLPRLWQKPEVCDVCSIPILGGDGSRRCSSELGVLAEDARRDAELDEPLQRRWRPELPRGWRGDSSAARARDLNDAIQRIKDRPAL